MQSSIEPKSPGRKGAPQTPQAFGQLPLEKGSIQGEQLGEHSRGAVRGASPKVAALIKLAEE